MNREIILGRVNEDGGGLGYGDGENRPLSIDAAGALWVAQRPGAPFEVVTSGAKTPSDAFANPSDAVGAWSLMGLWNGATWQRARAVTPSDSYFGTSTPLETFGLVALWDGLGNQGRRARCTQSAALLAQRDNLTAAQIAAGAPAQPGTYRAALGGVSNGSLGANVPFQ
jgi:hypothetical protein